MPLDPSEFESFELEHSLFDLQINGVPIWERLRFGVFNRIQRQHGRGQAHTSIDTDWRSYLRGAGLFAKNIVSKNPFLTEESDILYFGHQRRKKRDDGYWWDIYCDPIHEACEHDYVHFELPHLLDHHRPARTSNLRYLELIEYAGTIQRMLGVNEPTIPDTTHTRLNTIQRLIQERFNTDIDLISMVQSELYSRRTTLPLYRRLLERIDPDLAVIVVSYGKETFIEACKTQGIPVAELQHGVIYPSHFGYSYHGLRTKESFPDYLLVWGNFWRNNVEYPIPDDHVITIGYPYLEKEAAQYGSIESNQQLLFISQGAIGEKLSKFAIDVEQHSDIDMDIVYKLHPGEYDRWREDYPWLVDVEFDVLADSSRHLYELFAESSAQVGVYSTAVYEGLYFGLNTYLYDCPSAPTLEALINEGAATLVSSTDQLASALRDRNHKFDSQYYFAEDSIDCMCDTLNKLRIQ